MKLLLFIPVLVLLPILISLCILCRFVSELCEWGIDKLEQLTWEGTMD